MFVAIWVTAKADKWFQNRVYTTRASYANN